MEDSPLISPKVKEYCIKYNIESTLNEALNEALTTLPQDPYSFLCGKFKEHSQEIFKIENFELTEKIDSNLEQKLAFDITLNYQGTSFKVLSFFLPFSSEAIKIYKEKPDFFKELFNRVSEQINNYTIEQFTSFDKILQSIYENAQNDEEKITMKSLCNSISLSILISMSKMCHKDTIDFINKNLTKFKSSSSNIPDLGFVLFKTGKEMNSKVKFEKWLIFIDNSSSLSYFELKEIFSKLYNAIRKFLTAGKAGENGMRLNEEGLYTPPTDAMNDIMKLMENIIAEAGGNNLYYGIDCKGNNFYSSETKTYEMEGFKKPPDTEQMLEFYIKLLKDHPLLRYIEDPLADEDLRGNSNLMEKIKEECPNVRLSMRSIFCEKYDKLCEIIDKKEEEGKQEMNTINPAYRSRLINNEDRSSDIKEELTEREKKKLEEEEAEKKRKEEEEQARLLEEQRLKEEEEAKNLKSAKKKPEPKKPEPKKANVKKTEEELKKEKEEAEKLLPPPIPFTNLKCISIKMDGVSCISQLGTLTEKAKMKDLDVTIYDMTHETEQNAVVYLGIGFRVKRIVLHGLTLKMNKLGKVLEYIEKVVKLYKSNEETQDKKVSVINEEEKDSAEKK